MLVIPVGCTKEKESNDQVFATSGFMSATINGHSFYTTDVSMDYIFTSGTDLFGIGNIEEIFLEVTPEVGTYILQQGDCQEGYFDKVSTTHFFWAKSGQIEITQVEKNKKISGTFNFIVDINDNEIIITNGKFTMYH